jgi:NTP pyrophosphatase (non-canonical NTP hydrolase)
VSKTLDEYQAEIGAWGDKTFPNSTIGSVCSHLAEEVGEFLDAYLHGDDGQEEEAADVLLLLLHYAHKTGVSLYDVAERKMEVNRARTWKTEPEPGGHFKHVDTE